jgi:hypothetical protein
MQWKIELYEKENGRCPVVEYITSSLEQCHDLAEKMVCINIINSIMEEEKLKNDRISGAFMIKWYHNLYMDEKVKKKQNKYIQALEKSKFTFGLYCIAFASNDKNLFDIIETNELLFEHYKRNDIYIIGLAKGKDSAIELAESLLLEVYECTGNFKIREYFKFD